MGQADWRLAVDIGGTFTDVVLLDGATGRVVVDKTLTTEWEAQLRYEPWEFAASFSTDWRFDDVDGDEPSDDG